MNFFSSPVLHLFNIIVIIISSNSTEDSIFIFIKHFMKDVFLKYYLHCTSQNMNSINDDILPIEIKILG